MISKGLVTENLNNGYLYYIELDIENKRHYKVGYTKDDSVYKRFSYDGSNDYKYIKKVIFFHYFENAFELEQSIHRFLKKRLNYSFYPANKYPFYENGQSEIYPEDVLFLNNRGLNGIDKKRRDTYVNSWVEALPLSSEKCTKSLVKEFQGKPVLKWIVNIYRYLFGSPMLHERNRIRGLDRNYYSNKRAYYNALSLIRNCSPLRDYNLNRDPKEWLYVSSSNELENSPYFKGFPRPKRRVEWYQDLWDWADELEISPEILPRALDKLTALEELYICFNRNYKSIFINKHLGKLKNLKKLTLASRGSDIANFPSELGELKNLTDLSIESGSFHLLPDSIGNLINLKSLSLIGGKLLEIPASIGNLTSIKKMDLGSNNINYLPPEIGKLINLQELGLGGEGLDGDYLMSTNLIPIFPDEFSDLQKLKKLEMGDGFYASDPGDIEISETIFKLKNLESFSTVFILDKNITKFKKLKKLKELSGRVEYMEFYDKYFKKLKAIPTIHFFNSMQNVNKIDGVVGVPSFKSEDDLFFNHS